VIKQAVMLTAGAFVLSAPSMVRAQQEIRLDSIRQDSEAAITCGFCSGEKFGVIFREVQPGAGLPAAAFPLTLNKVQIAVAATEVRNLDCQPAAMGGMVNGTMEIYAGATAPTTITTLTGTGPWPGESTVLQATQVQLERSVTTGGGIRNWDVRLNELPVNQVVPAPNTYIRVQITIATGGYSDACSILGFQPPNISPFRDDDGSTGRTSYIYRLGTILNNEEYVFNEDFNDPSTGSAINGDWLVRLEVTPFGGPPADAGVQPPADRGVHPDAAPPPPMDSGVHPDADPVVFPDATVVPPPADAGVRPSGAPKVLAISPSKASVGTAVSVLIAGENFISPVMVRIGSRMLTSPSVINMATITATVPADISAGKHDVVVINGDGTPAILTEGYEATEGTARRGGIPPVDDGCTCVATVSQSHPWAVGMLLLGAWFVARRRRTVVPAPRRAR